MIPEFTVPDQSYPEGESNELLLRRYGVDRATVEQMYREWSEEKVPKSVVEARYLRTRRHHGKLFNRLVRNVLGKETQLAHPMVARVQALEEENARLRAMLEEHGISSERDPAPDTGQPRMFDSDG